MKTIYCSLIAVARLKLKLKPATRLRALLCGCMKKKRSVTTAAAVGRCHRGACLVKLRVKLRELTNPRGRFWKFADSWMGQNGDDMHGDLALAWWSPPIARLLCSASRRVRARKNFATSSPSPGRRHPVIAGSTSTPVKLPAFDRIHLQIRLGSRRTTSKIAALPISHSDISFMLSFPSFGSRLSR
jgi:hypothetical protein